MIARTLDEQVEGRLKAGGKVLLLPPLYTVAGDTHGSFEPIFWNRLWFPTQEVHTLGILCRPDHPGLAEFPTDSHSNWQWWEFAIVPSRWSWTSCLPNCLPLSK